MSASVTRNVKAAQVHVCARCCVGQTLSCLLGLRTSMWKHPPAAASMLSQAQAAGPCWMADGCGWCLQLHTHGDTTSCGPGGRLIISPADMRDIFVTSCAELPGLLIAAVLADSMLGRKG